MSDIKFILSVDLGGTHCRFQLREKKTTKWLIKTNAKFTNDDFNQFTDSLTAFLTKVGNPNTSTWALGIGIAGITTSTTGRLTNRPWSIHKADLQVKFGFQQIVLLNDLEATAWGLTNATPGEVLHSRRRCTKHPSLVIGVGTGFGMAYTCSTATGETLVFSGEAGESNVIPVTQDLFDLWHHMLNRYGHVSTELFLSGPGLENLYQYVYPTTEDISAPDILRLATDNIDGKAQEAINLFCILLAQTLGNLALIFRPNGGIHLTGGMITRILPWLKKLPFTTHYGDFRRMKEIILSNPVYAYPQDDLALIGSFQVALKAIDHGRNIFNSNRDHVT